MPEAFMTDTQALIFAVVGAATLLFGAGVLLYERFAPASRRYFLYAIMVSLWLLGSAVAWYSPASSRVWLRLAWGADALVGPALYWLVLMLTGARRPVSARIAWVAGIALMALGLSTDLVVDGVVALQTGGPAGAHMLPAVALFGLLAACVGAAVRELVLAYRRAGTRDARRRHGLVLAAFGVAALGFMDLFLPWLGAPPLLVTPIALMGGLVFIGMAASRHRLLSGVSAFATREVVRTMSDAVFVMDLNGVVRSANPAAEAISGYRGQHLRDLPISDLLTDSGPLRFHTVLQGCRDREMLLRPRRGEPVSVSVSAEPLREGPRVTGAVVVARDIRERLRVEQAMRASELRYSSLFWHNPGIAYEFAPDGTILGANTTATRMFAEEGSDLIGRNLSDVVPPAEMEEALAIVARVLEGKPQAYEIGLMTPAGERRLMRGVSIPVSEAGGEVTSIFGVAQDITEEDQAKRELEVQRRYFAELFESSPEAIVLVGPTGEVRRVNGEFCTLFGYTEEDALGESLDLLIVPEDLRQEGARLDDAARNGGMARAETRRRRKDGTTVAVSVLAREVDIPGEPPQMYGIYRDITDRVAAERKLREREEELRHAQKLEAVGKLAGGVAHDFNNLLTVINGHARFVLDTLELVNPVREDLEEIERAGIRAAGLTQQLLAFSRRQVLHSQVLDLNAIIGDMERLLHRLVGEELTLVIQLTTDPTAIIADRGQVEQVVMNLAVNARDAMPDGGVLSIRTDIAELSPGEPQLGSWEVNPGRYIRLIVEDSGTGMAPETLARAFDPFFTTKERGKGTGLGLATVFGILKQSGGHITAETEAGAGSRFVAYLPVADRVDFASSKGAPENTDAGYPAQRTVLVVEDEEAVRRLAARVLERQGYAVLTAADGVEALEVIGSRSAEIHLVLSDLVMPRMGGRELADRLAERSPAIPMVFMSGYDEELATGRGSFDAGFIAKPFTPAALAEKVMTALVGHPSPR